MHPKPIEPIDHHEVSLQVATIQLFKQQGTSPPPYPRISVFGRSFLDQLPGCGGVFLFIRQQFQTFEPYIPIDILQGSLAGELPNLHIVFEPPCELPE